VPGRPRWVTAWSGTGTVRTPQPGRALSRRPRSGRGRPRAAGRRCPVMAGAGHQSGNAGDGRASPGIWPAFQAVGIVGPVPAQTCGQARVTLTWMPGRRARGGRAVGGQLELRRRAAVPGLQTEPPSLPGLTGDRRYRPARPMPFRPRRPGSPGTALGTVAAADRPDARGHRRVPRSPDPADHALPARHPGAAGGAAAHRDCGRGHVERAARRPRCGGARRPARDIRGRVPR
jgi:hypothetical protein